MNNEIYFQNLLFGIVTLIVIIYSFGMLRHLIWKIHWSFLNIKNNPIWR